MQTHPHRQSPAAGFTLVELMLVVGIVSLLAAMAFPNLRRAQIAANESSAIGSLRTVSNAQQSFWTSCGYGMYAATLQILGTAVAGQPGYLSADLAGPVPVVKSGYEFDLASDGVSPLLSCNGDATVPGFHVSADPRLGKGRRYFGVNTSGTIYQSTVTLFGVITDSAPPPAPATPISQH